MNEAPRKEVVPAVIAETATEAHGQHEPANPSSSPADHSQQHAHIDSRMDDLDRRIRELENAIGDLRSVTAAAVGTERGSGPRTHRAHTPHLMAKYAEPASSASLDEALRGLTPEQRIGVKSGLLRAGLL